MARILVVDDEPDIRLVVESLLISRGHLVTTAVDGTTALRTLAGEAFDLVVLDIMMPGLSGIEVLDAIRADRRLRDLPVLMLSAISDAAGRARGLRHGADDYVGKPFDIEELALRVERLAKRSSGSAATLTGDLAFLAGGGLLELLAQTKVAMRISMPAGDGWGEMSIVRGRLAAASWGALEGSEAALALLEQGSGRFSIAEDPADSPVADDAPLVHSLLLERAWLEDEIRNLGASVPAADCALEPAGGGEPAGSMAREVPWQRVLEVIRARPGVRPSELPALLPLAPARIRLALALLVEACCVRALAPHGKGAGEERSASLLSDLLLEALFRGHDVDHLKVEMLADAPGYERAASWLERIPPALAGDGCERAVGDGERLSLRVHHPTGRAEVVLRRLGDPPSQAASMSADAVFCVLLVLESTPEARHREAQLLLRLAATKPRAAELVWISSAPREAEPVAPWRRAPTLPETLGDLFAALLGRAET